MVTLFTFQSKSTDQSRNTKETVCCTCQRVLLALLLLMIVVSAAAQTSQGLASWYGPGFHNRLTASGEVFDRWELTAAHLTLPFGTRVRVTNLDNQQSIVVRINDRGPFVHRRIIDLSQGAAEELGMVSSGVAPVRVEVIDVNNVRAEVAVASVPTRTTVEATEVAVQAASTTLEVAQAAAQEIDQATYRATVSATLETYTVASKAHEPGELLLLESDQYDAPLMVRVAAQLDDAVGSDLLVSSDLYAKLGSDIYVVSGSN